MAKTGTEIKIEQQQQEQQQQQQLPGNRIYLVTDGLRSKHTKANYRLAFNQFLRDGAKTTDLRVLLDYKPKVIEEMVIRMEKEEARMKTVMVVMVAIAAQREKAIVQAKNQRNN